MSVDVGAQLGIPNIAVLETLGRGGFGVVYKAFDSKMNRPVAVKVLTSVVDQSDLERFEQECRLHGPLSNHPSIVTVYDAGYTSNGSPYLVMELIEGGTLADHVARSGPVRWEQAVEWMSPICDAVQAAHDRGVLHRDIKPSNILLAPGGPRLADFGIACLSDATSPHFAVSWLHAAPESHENTRDARSDVYSLASTLYELVAGRAPFWAQDQQITKLMIRLIEEPPPHLPPPLGPRWLDDVLQRALSKNPAERPPTAAALAAALANRHAAGTAHAPFGFAAPILPLAGGPLSEQVTRLDLAPASVRLDSGSVSAQGWPVAGAAAGLAWSGEPSVIVVEQPRRRRGGLVAVAAALVAIGVAGLALSPAGADIVDRLTGPQPTVPTATTVDGSGTTPTSAAGAGSTTTSTSPSTSQASSEPETGVTTSSTHSTDPTGTSGTHTTGTTDHTGTTKTTSSTAPQATTVEVPNLKGDPIEHALSELDDLGFTNVTVESEPSETVPAGAVIRTDPVAGKEIEPDTHLRVYESSGPEVVEVDVPNVTGLTRSDAEEALHAAGLVPVVQLKTLAADSADIGRVLAQDPDGGTAPAGSEVTITVGRKPLVVQQPNVTIGTVPVATIGP